MLLHASGTWGVARLASRAPPNLAYASRRADCLWDRYSVRPLPSLFVDEEPSVIAKPPCRLSRCTIPSRNQCKQISRRVGSTMRARPAVGMSQIVEVLSAGQLEVAGFASSAERIAAVRSERISALNP